MKTFARFALVAVVALVSPCSFAAEASPPSAATPQTDVTKPSFAGTFAGTWRGDGDATGALRIKLTPNSTAWTAEASFTYQEKEVATSIKSVKIEGAKIEVVVDYTIDDTRGGTTLAGEIAGDKIQGAYVTNGFGDPGHGTWSVTRK